MMNTNILLGNFALNIGGFLSLGIALLHIGIIFKGAKGYRYFTAGDKIVELAQKGSIIPALVTSPLVLSFLVFSLYAFSASQLIPISLPFQNIVIKCIAVIYLIRGSAVILQLLPIEKLQILVGCSSKEVIFSLVPLITGCFYALGIYST